jgi:hypothetical protein
MSYSRNAIYCAQKNSTKVAFNLDETCFYLNSFIQKMDKGSDLPPAYPARQPYQQQQYGQPLPDAQYQQGPQQGPYPGQQPPQQPYGQQQYAPQPAAPTTVVIVNQPPPPQDYTFPNGKCTSVVLIICALGNLICFFAVGASFGLWGGTEWIAAFIFYGIAGVLGAIGSFNKQDAPGIPVGTIVMAVFSMIIAFVQVISSNFVKSCKCFR